MNASARLKGFVRAVRLLFIPAVWLCFVPYAINAGYEPGFVSLRSIHPYPTRHVFAVCALMALESMLLFSMLSPLQYQFRDWRRPLKATGLLILAFLLEPMVTDMPGYMYVNAAFLFTWSLITGALVLIGLAISRLVLETAKNAADHAA